MFRFDRSDGAGRSVDGAPGFRTLVPGDGGSTLRPSLARMDGVVQSPCGRHADRGLVPGGGQRASGGGRADGDAVGTLGGGGGFGAPRFDIEVQRNGYAWWYADGWSADGRHGITLIAFIGSVFSPYYARARAKGPAIPEDHVALNVALYGRSHRRWTMTERSQRALSRDATQLQIGPSAVRRDGDGLVFDIDEIGMPVPRRVYGTVRVRPKIPAGPTFALDAEGAHRWQPLAPLAEIEVDLPLPGLRWRGEGYLDTNMGDAPLETAFKQWHWARAAAADGARIVYSVERRDGTRHAIAAVFDGGGMQRFSPPPETALARTWWGIARPACADPGTNARVMETLEDTPFYARSTIDSTWNGTRVSAMHESLSLDRFASRWVRALLPFRMPRISG